MTDRVVRSASYNASDPDEVGAHKLRERIRRWKGLPTLDPVEDCEDATHNIMTQLLAEAKQRKMTLAGLVQADPRAIYRKLEAERSRVRRRRDRLGREMSEEMAESLPAQYRLLPTVDSKELLARLAQKAELSKREAEFLFLRYACGIDDSEALRELIGVPKEELYRIKHRMKAKLAAIPEVVKSQLEQYEHPAQTNPGQDGVWKKNRSRNL